MALGRPQEVGVESWLALLVEQDRDQQHFARLKLDPQLAAIRAQDDIEDTVVVEVSDRVGNPPQVVYRGDGHSGLVLGKQFMQSLITDLLGLHEQRRF